MLLYKNKFYLILALLINASILFSQKTNTDSLWKVYHNNAIVDSLRLDAISSIATAYSSNNPDTAIIIANQMFDFLKTHPSLRFEASAYNTLATAFLNKGDNSKALHYFNKTYSLSEKLNDPVYTAKCLNNLSLVQRSLANFPKSLEYALMALKIRERYDQKKTASSYNNIGLIYYQQHQNTEALKYFLIGLKNSITYKNEFVEGLCYINIGNVYSEQGKKDSALLFCFKALTIFKKQEDVSRVGTCYANISEIYQYKKDYTNALEYIKNAIKLKRQAEDLNDLGACFLILGSIYDNLNNNSLAIVYLDSAKNMHEQTNNVNDLTSVYSKLSDVYSKLGNFKDAYFYLSLNKKLTDSIFNSDNTAQLSSLKTQFEVEKKEVELNSKAQAQKQITDALEKKQQIIIIAICVFLFAVVVFSTLLYNRFKITKQQNHIIKAQKNQVEIHQKEILDSIQYAKRIQSTILKNQIISGDFYWAHRKNNNYYIAVCDCTGHGVPGAFMSLLSIGYLNEAIENNILAPNTIFDYVRERLIQNISQEDQKDGFDGILLCIDGITKQITYAAANNKPVLISNGFVIKQKVDKMPVGKGERTDPFNLYHLNYNKGDVLYLYTDGYADQFGGPKGKKYKYKPLNEILLNNSTIPLKDQYNKLSQEFNNWKGDLEQVDDVCIVGIKI
jgi:serine phosphatase RsbU (regulator of sigma subunit)